MDHSNPSSDPMSLLAIEANIRDRIFRLSRENERKEEDLSKSKRELEKVNKAYDEAVARCNDIVTRISLLELEIDKRNKVKKHLDNGVCIQRSRLKALDIRLKKLERNRDDAVQAFVQACRIARTRSIESLDFSINNDKCKDDRNMKKRNVIGQIASCSKTSLSHDSAELTDENLQPDKRPIPTHRYEFVSALTLQNDVPATEKLPGHRGNHKSRARLCSSEENTKNIAVSKSNSFCTLQNVHGSPIIVPADKMLNTVNDENRKRKPCQNEQSKLNTSRKRNYLESMNTKSKGSLKNRKHHVSVDEEPEKRHSPSQVNNTSSENKNVEDAFAGLSYSGDLNDLFTGFDVVLAFQTASGSTS